MSPVVRTQRPWVAVVLLATAFVLGRPGGSSPDRAWALNVDAATSRLQPGNALVMPFDVSEGKATILQVANAGQSPRDDDDGMPVGAVNTHWTFLAEGGSGLGSVDICILDNGSVLVDPRVVYSRDVLGNQVGPTLELGGTRGIVIVTAYATDRFCNEASSRGFAPIDDAIYGRFSIGNAETFVGGGADALALGTNGSATATDLPNFELSPKQDLGFVDVQTERRDKVVESSVVFVAVEEKMGTIPGEIGLVEAPVTASTRFVDSTGSATDLPGLLLPGVSIETTSLRADSFLGNVPASSSGFVRLTGLSTAEGNVGGDSFVYGVHGQALDESTVKSYVDSQYPALPDDVRRGVETLRRTLLGGGGAIAADESSGVERRVAAGQLHRGSPLFRVLAASASEGRRE